MQRLNRTIFFLSAIVLLLLPGCGSRQMRMTLNDIESYINERPDSALAAIRSIDTLDLKSRAEKARYSLLHAMALDKNWIDTADVRVVMPAVEYYSKRGPLEKRAKAYYYLGLEQANEEDYASACISFLKAERLSSNLGDSRFECQIYQAISSVYDNSSLFEEALKYTNKAYITAIEIKDSVAASASRYCMASNMHNLGRINESDSLFHLVLADPNLDIHLVDRAVQGYAVLLASGIQDYARAIELFERTINEYGGLSSQVEWGAYAYSLLREGRTTDSDFIFDQLEKEDSPSDLSFKKWKSMAEAYKGNYSSAYEWLDKASNVQLNNVLLALQQSSIKEQRDYYENEDVRNQLKAKNRGLLLLFSTLLFAVLAFFIYQMFKRRNERIKSERERVLNLYRMLEESSVEIDRARIEIRDRYIRLFKSHYGQIGRINEKLVFTKDKNSDLYLYMRSAIKSLRLDDDGQMEIEKMLNDSFDNVMEKLREAFPNKNPRFYKFASHIFVGFDAATICILSDGYNKESVYTEKSRLKKLILKTDSQYKEEFLRLIT